MGYILDMYGIYTGYGIFIAKLVNITPITTVHRGYNELVFMDILKIYIDR